MQVSVFLHEYSIVFMIIVCASFCIACESQIIVLGYTYVWYVWRNRTNRDLILPTECIIFVKCAKFPLFEPTNLHTANGECYVHEFLYSTETVVSKQYSAICTVRASAAAAEAA